MMSLGDDLQPPAAESAQRMYTLEGKVALITGAGAGIGRGIAVGLAGLGANVCLTDLPDEMERLEELRLAIDRMGRRALTRPLDVTRVEMMDPLVETIVHELGALDILINNAGGGLRKSPLDITEQEWDRDVDLNLKGAFFCAQAAARAMMERGGAIVNLASIFGLVGRDRGAAYCAAKGGVVNLTRALAVSWAPYNVRVNAIAPTFTKTSWTTVLADDPEASQEIIDRTPLGRWAEVEDIVGPVAFLASPASSMITGQTLAVDGGWTAL